jgi:hypothetical protein
MSGLIETIEKNAIEAREIFNLFCEHLAKLFFAAEVVKPAEEVCKDMIGHLRADETICEFKFKNSLTVDPVRNDAEESSPHLKRAQIGNRPFTIGGVSERPKCSKNLALQDCFYGRTENQCQWKFEELFNVFASRDNVFIAIVEQDKKTMTLNTAGDAYWLICTVLAWPSNVAEDCACLA